MLALNFDLAEHLPAPRPFSERWHLMLIALAASFSILYLAHYKGTRLLRLAIWPAGPAALSWFILTVDLKYKTVNWTPVMGTVFHAVSASTRWAFADHPPSYRPLPPTLPSWARSFRELTPVKAFNLIYIEARLVGLSDGPAFKTARRNWLRGALYQLSRAALYTIAVDLCSLPLYLLDPTNLGRPWSLGEPHDWAAGVASMAKQTGLPGWVLEVVMTLNYGWLIYISMLCGWHILAFVGTATGLWADDEFPPLMDAPWKAESHNELWGKRYHQVMRSNFNLVTLPLAFLPPSLRILRIFLGSAIYHMIIYYPLIHNFNFWPTLYMFMAPALLCSAERLYKNITGKRVGGWAGRIWVWVGFVVCMYPGVVSLTENGWVAALRNEIAGEKSVVEVVLWKLGWTGQPVKNLAQGW